MDISLLRIIQCLDTRQKKLSNNPFDEISFVSVTKRKKSIWSEISWKELFYLIQSTKKRIGFVQEIWSGPRETYVSDLIYPSNFFCSTALTSAGWVRSTIKLLLHILLLSINLMAISRIFFLGNALAENRTRAGRARSMNATTVLCRPPTQVASLQLLYKFSLSSFLPFVISPSFQIMISHHHS